MLIHFLFDLRRCCDNIEIEQAFPSGEKSPRLILRFKKQDHYKILIADNFDSRALLRMTSRAGRALTNPEARPSLIGFNKKQLIMKVFLIGSFKFVGEQCELAACLTRKRVFPGNVEVNTPGRFSISAIPKQHLRDYFLAE